MWIGNQKTTNNNKVRAIEQKFVPDAVKQNILGSICDFCLFNCILDYYFSFNF